MGFCRPGCQAALKDTWEEGGRRRVREGDKRGRKREKRGRLQTACRVGARWMCSASLGILYLLHFVSALIVVFLHNNDTITKERKRKKTRYSEDREGYLPTERQSAGLELCVALVTPLLSFRTATVCLVWQEAWTVSLLIWWQSGSVLTGLLVRRLPFETRRSQRAQTAATGAFYIHAGSLRPS